MPEAALIAALAGNSPFLAGIMQRHPADCLTLMAGDPTDLFEVLIKDMTAPRPDGEKMPDLMAVLRNLKTRVSFLTAYADISGRWQFDDVTTALSRFADAALTLSLAHLLHDRMQRGDLAWPKGEPEPVTPALTENCGYFLLGMGKLGAYELNYSSDIDLIALYDASRVTYSGRKSVSDCFIKITQDLVQMMDRRTMHGYVFRTDLRLRPDPGATPVAISVEAAENYYHSMAVNWERSAMIKARPSAGDKAAAEAYLGFMSSWIWRRNMDFAALADIAAIKHQINRHYGTSGVRFAGYNVKLGHGGIREIEFFAQINQLLFAGRHPRLRIRGTLDALDALATDGLIEPKVHKDLSESYVFLRTLEHRIQMVADEQTHQIPEDEAGQDRLATFMGLADRGALKAEVLRHSDRVSAHYDALLPEDETSESGFNEQDLESNLAEMKFDDPASSAGVIEGWRRGRHRALRTERAKHLLDQMLPGLLEAFAKTDKPSAALMRFDSFIAQQPAGVQLFSLLHANPSLFQLLAHVMGLAPALADTLAKKPALWDAVLEPHFFDPIEDEDTLADMLRSMLHTANDYQDMLDYVRRFVAELRFRIGVQLLESLSDVREAGEAMTRVADVTLKVLVPEVEKEFARRHGRFPGGGICLLGMGKYGGRELTQTSDLDMVFLYHVEDMNSMSDGDKPLGPSQYFSRLGQHIITAITALTPEGRLFEVDTRLRPSGHQGPLVVTLKTFTDYYSSAAWTWEHMALTRARIIIAPDALRDALTDTIRSVLTSPRDADDLLLSVHDMRLKVEAQFGTKNPWAIKYVRGGLVDIEFICQYLMLREGHKTPGIFHPEISETIKRLRAKKVLPEADTELMASAHFLLQNVQSLLRLSLGSSPRSEEQIPEGLRTALCRATHTEDFGALKETVLRQEARLYSLYKRVIEEPAYALLKARTEQDHLKGD
ncbi:bifunctional [glutamine synthetase] adenylyltransferase/[glutamine synthetase]-adenylyl-L-tyrosine phosphorylase [Kordiimonas sp. A6E486]|nr:bifunctional [glutamine synthetase] adenylyltransferase/[glutamine synthetase]-adenylyl-L-tyrosine phosphorylase [Kordiimonas marina]